MNDSEVITTEQPQTVDAEKSLFDFQTKVELEFRERIGGTFEKFARHVAPSNPRHADYLEFQHIKQMMQVLDRVVNGELTHVMFFLPPQYYKSSIVSRLFSAYFLFKHPQKWVGLASYSGDLAQIMSRSSMDFYTRAGMELHPDAQSTREWMTIWQGGMWAAGVGGSISGRSGNLGIIDDPFKDDKEAYSQRIRESRIDWYRSVWSSRNFEQEILIFTRWHESDLAGYLFTQEVVNPKGWHVFVFDAIKDEHPMPVPSTCVLETDWRVPGEALCPQIHTSEQLVAKHADASELFWSSLWQQRPVMTRGNKWKVEWFYDHAIDDIPPNLISLGYDWDTAQTDDSRGAANAYIKAGIRDGAMYIIDLGWEWFEFPELILWMKAKVDAPHYVEAKSSWKDVVSTLKREGIAAHETQVVGDKESRTDMVLHFAQQGKIHVARHLLDKLLFDGKQGVLAFPNGRWRDLNDALVQSVNRLLKREHTLSFVGA